MTTGINALDRNKMKLNRIIGNIEAHNAMVHYILFIMQWFAVIYTQDRNENNGIRVLVMGVPENKELSPDVSCMPIH